MAPAALPGSILMIAGHFGFSALVKAREPQVPLWALMLATVWLDVIFVPLLLGGIETIEKVPGSMGSYGNGIIHADYTHSLLGALLISAVSGLIAAIPWGRRCGIVLGAVVFSHWVLDLVVHRGDLPILPGNLGNLPELGFGLWRFPTAAIAAELLLVLAGAFFYWQAATTAVNAAGGTSPAGGTARRRADITAALILISGCLILFLDATG